MSSTRQEDSVSRRYILITPVKNEEENLQRLIESIVKQTIKPLLWIIIDDGSTDRSSELIKQWKKKTKHRVKLIWHRKSRGVAISKNEGIKAAKGEVIVLFDADNYFPSNYVSLGVKALSSTRLGVVPKITFTTDTMVERALASVTQPTPEGEHLPFIWRKRDLLRLGNYDEALIVHEDHDLAKRANALARDKGKEIYLYSNLPLYVHLPHSLYELYCQQRWYGRGFIAYLKKYPELKTLRLAAKLGYPLIFLAPLGVWLGNILGVFLFSLSLPLILQEVIRIKRGLKRGELSAVLTPFLDGVKWIGFSVGLFESFFRDKKER